MLNSLQRSRFKRINSLRNNFSSFKKNFNQEQDIDMIAIYEQSTGRSIKGSSSRATGICPFPDHQDKTPSFSIYPRTNSYYCFGCQKSGTASWFKHEMERIYGQIQNRRDET